MTQPTIFELSASRQFPEWLTEHNLSLAFTTYQAGKLFFLGTKPDGGLSVFERTFNRCMGLWASEQTLWLSSLYQLYRFEAVQHSSQLPENADRLYVPQVGYITGDLDVHDVAVDETGRIIFVNTLFSCLATVSDTHSFAPLWKPPFIDRLAAEDRCHLNGMAMDNGRPQYVTVVSRSNAADGWRDRRHDGGCVVDVPSGEIVATGLSMPHSPRVYRDRLWVLNSGTGHFGFIDRDKGCFEPVTFCAGYQRGLSFHGDYAIVGLSKQRENRTFSGLQLDQNLADAQVDPRCGLLIIDLRTGDAVHWAKIDGIITELYDVVALPGSRQPQALGFKTDEIRRVLSVDEERSL